MIKRKVFRVNSTKMGERIMKKITLLTVSMTLMVLVGCQGEGRDSSAASTQNASTSYSAAPGAGKPPVVAPDPNKAYGVRCPEANLISDDRPLEALSFYVNKQRFQAGFSTTAGGVRDDVGRIISSTVDYTLSKHLHCKMSIGSKSGQWFDVVIELKKTQLCRINPNPGKGAGFECIDE